VADPLPIVDPEVAARLPATYLRVIEGVTEGVDDATLAARAEVEVSAVPALVRLALAKLLEVQESVRDLEA
jgi:hypothetical protein